MDAHHLTVICWRWAPKGPYRSIFAPETVHRLKAMVARHYPFPHDFLCITDDPEGLEGVDTLPLWPEWGDIPAPSGPKNPSCYRRLRLFAPDAKDWAGPRVVSLDLDCVVTGDLTPLWHRPEDLVLYGDTNPTTYYSGPGVALGSGPTSIRGLLRG